jgi:hypothetical protein
MPLARSLLRVAGFMAATDEPRPTCPSQRQRLPLVPLHDVQSRRTPSYAASAIDDRGRLADRSPLQAMQWEPGTSLRLSACADAGVIVVQRHGPFAVTVRGHLRLPADVRHACRVRPGDRVLVVALPADGAMVLFTPSAVDTMCFGYLSSMFTEAAT